MERSLAFLALAPLVLSAPAAAQATRTLAPPPVPRPALHVAPVHDPARFTPAHERIGFDDILPGDDVRRLATTLGVSFELLGGDSPKVWDDPAPRVGAPGGPGSGAPLGLLGGSDRAIRVEQVLEDLWPVPAPALGEGVPSALPAEPALHVGFRRPVTRVALEARSLDPNGSTLVVSACRGGEPIGTVCVSAGAEFQLVGLESSLAFDALRIDLVNPASGLLSVDGVRYELDRADADGDGVPDFADVCPALFDPSQADADGDGRGDACDPWPLDPGDDVDADGIPSLQDNCPQVFNPDQTDADGDGLGDPCDPLPLGIDSDGDGIPDPLDNCPTTYNPEQLDVDGDGIGDVCDANLMVTPAVSLTLARGEQADVHEQFCLPPVPQIVDVVLAVDNTGSMSGEIANIKGGLVEAVNRLRQVVPSDLKMALVTFRDYPGTHASCGYSLLYGGTGDWAFRVDAPIGVEDHEVIAAVQAMQAGGGADHSESYARVLWEASQPDSGLDLRPGAASYVVLVGDANPHDCGLDEGLSCLVASTTGSDPGRDEVVLTADDLDFHDDALANLTRRRLQFVYSGTTSSDLCAWGSWVDDAQGALLQINSNGSIPPGLSMVRTFLKLLGGGEYLLVEPRVLPGSGLVVNFDPPRFVGPFSKNKVPGLVGFTTTVFVPPSLPAGVTAAQATIELVADGAVIGTQVIDVTIP